MVFYFQYETQFKSLEQSLKSMSGKFLAGDPLRDFLFHQSVCVGGKAKLVSL